ADGCLSGIKLDSNGQCSSKVINGGTSSEQLSIARFNQRFGTVCKWYDCRRQYCLWWFSCQYGDAYASSGGSWIYSYCECRYYGCRRFYVTSSYGRNAFNRKFCRNSFYEL